MCVFDFEAERKRRGNGVRIPRQLSGQGGRGGAETHGAAMVPDWKSLGVVVESLILEMRNRR